MQTKMVNKKQEVLRRSDGNMALGLNAIFRIFDYFVIILALVLKFGQFSCFAVLE